jgi:hypothetical protein
MPMLKVGDKVWLCGKGKFIKDRSSAKSSAGMMSDIRTLYTNFTEDAPQPYTVIKIKYSTFVILNSGNYTLYAPFNSVTKVQNYET